MNNLSKIQPNENLEFNTILAMFSNNRFIKLPLAYHTEEKLQQLFDVTGVGLFEWIDLSKVSELLWIQAISDFPVTSYKFSEDFKFQPPYEYLVKSIDSGIIEEDEIEFDLNYLTKQQRKSLFTIHGKATPLIDHNDRFTEVCRILDELNEEK